MIALEVLLRLGALPLQQLLLLGSEMAHLPLLGALVSDAQASAVAPLVAGWLTAGWARLTATIAAAPRRTKPLLLTRNLPLQNAAPHHYSGRTNIAALDLLLC